MKSHKIRIKLRSYDHRLIDRAVSDIMERLEQANDYISGPIPLPTCINRYTVLRSPHVDKKARDQFQICTHKRLIDIFEPKQQTIDALMKLDLASGVDVEIKLFDK